MPIALGVRGLGAGPPGGDGWTPALPTTDGGVSPEHWYRSDQGLWQDAGINPAVADGDVVGRWEDITANNDHVNQANAANKPTLQNGAGDTLNGHPVIRADGIDDSLQGAFTTGGAMAQPNTIFAVAKLDAVSVNDDINHAILDGDDVVNRSQLYTFPTDNPDSWALFTGGGSAVHGGATDSTWHIFTALFASAVPGSLWVDGVLVDARLGLVNVPMDGLTVGARYDGAGNWWDGDATEILIYEPNLSDADKNQIGNYLAARYGLAYTDI